MTTRGKLVIISLGWGVQSFGLAAMVAKGVLPPVDYAIHADTTHERSETYALAKKYTPWLEKRGVRVVTVRGGRRVIGLGNLGESEVSIPAFTAYHDDDVRADGDPSGMLRRQCTKDWKIRPIRRWLSGELQRRRLKKTPGVIEQWLGITLDESARMKRTDVKYITNVFPFIEMLDHPWQRGEVIRWLRDNDLDIPVKSSCVFCPYRDRATWREIKMSGNGDWEKALEVDRAIRHKRPGYLCYLTSVRKPLDEIDFRGAEDHGQLSLWETEECSGMCFL